MIIELRNLTNKTTEASEEGDTTKLQAWTAEADKRNRRANERVYDARIAPIADELHKIVDGELVAKTDDELLKDKVITKAEYDERKRATIDGQLRAIDGRLYMHRATREWFIKHPSEIEAHALAAVKAAEDEAKALREARP
jgi:hypothetical protein